MGEYLSVSEAADLLGVSLRTVRRRITDGTLRGTRIPGRGGGEWRILADDVQNLLTVGVPRSGANPLDSAARCQGVRADGKPCRGLAMLGSKYCRFHQEQGT